MEHVSQRAVFILGSAMVIALLIVAMILLSGFASDATDPRRARLFLRLRAGAQALSVAMILLIAWLAKGA